MAQYTRSQAIRMLMAIRSADGGFSLVPRPSIVDGAYTAVVYCSAVPYR